MLEQNLFHLQPEDKVHGSIPTLYYSPLIHYACLQGAHAQDFYTVIGGQSNLQTSRLSVMSRGNSVYYPRDEFQHIAGILFASDAHGRVVAEKILGNTTPSIISSLGEGGKVLRSGRVILLTEEMRGIPEITLLESAGYSIDFLPLPPQNCDDELAVRMRHNNHIDTELNIALQLDTPVIVVNSMYYKQYKGVIDMLSGKYEAEIVEIKADAEQTVKRAVNFIELPNGKILLPYGCDETASKLQAIRGTDNVIVTNIDCRIISNLDSRLSSTGGQIIYYKHGGIRCMTNIVF